VTIALLYIHPRNFFRSLLDGKFARFFKEHILSPHQSNAMKAVSVGFGAFMGIIPIWGFQSVVAIALAVLLRLNKVLVIIASNVSFPPFIPFILYGSLMTGSLLQNKAAALPALHEITLDLAWQSLEAYVIGSIILAVSVGVLLGLITYAFLELTQRKSKAHNQNQI
jgi:uncharacterized protein (DUF2062 family)